METVENNKEKSKKLTHNPAKREPPLMFLNMYFVYRYTNFHQLPKLDLSVHGVL